MAGKRVVFVSSPVYGLEGERKFIRAFLQRRRSPPRFRVILSEEPSFPLTPAGIAKRHSYKLCLDVVRTADYVVLLLSRRYGRPIIAHNGSRISITHREYREAFGLRLPVFTFVDVRTWEAWHQLKKTGRQTYVPKTQVQVFKLVQEIAQRKRNNWIFQYRDVADLRVALRTVLTEFDDSQFVTDVLVADGDEVKTGTTFTKAWRIRNTGSLTWEDRYLVEENPGVSGLEPAKPRVKIPRTEPGDEATISVQFRAPRYPTTGHSEWKMTDRAGRRVFKHKKGLFCRVKVVCR